MRKVNNYVIPERQSEPTRADAIKRIQEVYAANRDQINRRIIETMEESGAYIRGSYYDVFESEVLERLSAEFGGEDRRERIKVNGKWKENKIDIEQALNDTLRGIHYTPYKERAKRNFLSAIKSGYSSYWRFLQKQFTGRTYDEVPLDNVWYNEGEDAYYIRLPDGSIVYFVKEEDKNGYKKWVLYNSQNEQIFV